MLRHPLFLVITVVLLWFIAAFLVLPNVTVLRSVFVAPDGSLTLRSIDRLLGSERAMNSLRNSFLLAVILSVTVNAVGIFIVLVTRFYDIKGASVLWLGYATTLIYGGIVLVSGYKTVYGSNGIITNALLAAFPDFDPNWFSGMFAVVFVMTFAATGNHLLFLSAAIARVDFQTVEAARMMGASNWSVLRKVVLPVIKPMIYAITILTFLGGLGALAAPQVLGGSGFQTITPMILSFANSPTSRDLSATLAIILGISSVVLLVVLNRMEKGGVYFSVSKVPTSLQKQRISNPVANVAVHIVAYALFTLYVLPPALIVLFSFTDARSINSGTITLDSFTLQNYVTVLTTESGYKPFLVSVAYSAVTAAVVIVLMLFTARMIQRYRNALTIAMEYLLHIPWILPSTMVALGLVMTFDRPQAAVFGWVLTGTVGILALAYVIGKIPFTFRLLKAAFSGVPDNIEDAAAILGASPMYTFRRVVFPLVLPTAAALTALNFNSLLDDYDTAVFLAHPLFQPLGLVIKSATSGETINDSTALTFVYTVLLMVISAFTMWLVYGRSGKRRATPSHS
nr:putative 2-aminoethylphosphonate transport system permease protein PhnV [Cryobacterium sp. SO1]